MVAPLSAAQGCALLHALCMFFLFSSAGASIGVNYGTNGDNLPTPQQAVQLLKKQGITQARIYDTNSAVLQAFQGSNIQLIVGAMNSEVLSIGGSNASAFKWVKDNIVPYASTCNITCIAVGNEALTSDPSLSAMLLPAIKLIHTSLVSFGLDSQIKVSSPCAVGLLDNTFPPSSGAFNSTYAKPVVQPILDFLSQTGSFFMLNVYPFKAYQQSSQVISLDYALFRPNPGVVDSSTGFLYTNAFDALVDATYTAMAALNHTDLTIVVSETGWPSQGDPTELGVSATNAQTYNSNLIKHVLNKTGTPGRPGVVIMTYVYELFNEDKNVGPSSQRNCGIFNADMSAVYAVDLSGSGITDTPSTVTTNKTWCVAKQGASDNSLQAAIDYACGQGRADCSEIQVGMPCYTPNSKEAHASYAMNSYFQKNNMALGTCDFQGTATLTTTDPSYGSCIFTASSPLAAQTAASTTTSGQMMVQVQPMTNLLVSVLAMLLMLNLKY